MLRVVKNAIINVPINRIIPIKNMVFDKFENLPLIFLNDLLFSCCCFFAMSYLCVAKSSIFLDTVT